MSENFPVRFGENTSPAQTPELAPEDSGEGDFRSKIEALPDNTIFTIYTARISRDQYPVPPSTYREALSGKIAHSVNVLPNIPKARLLEDPSLLKDENPLSDPSSYWYVISIEYRPDGTDKSASRKLIEGVFDYDTFFAKEEGIHSSTSSLPQSAETT